MEHFQHHFLSSKLQKLLPNLSCAEPGLTQKIDFAFDASVAFWQMKLMSFVISKVSANHTRRPAHPSCQAETGKLYESVVGFQNQSASFCRCDKSRKQRLLPLNITEDGEEEIQEAAATEFSTDAAVVYQSLIILGLKDEQRTAQKAVLGRQSSFQRCGA